MRSSNEPATSTHFLQTLRPFCGRWHSGRLVAFFMNSWHQRRRTIWPKVFKSISLEMRALLRRGAASKSGVSAVRRYVTTVLQYCRVSYSNWDLQENAENLKVFVVQRSLNIIPGILRGHQHRSRWFINKINIVYFLMRFLIHFSWIFAQNFDHFLGVFSVFVDRSWWTQ